MPASDVAILARIRMHEALPAPEVDGRSRALAQQDADLALAIELEEHGHHGIAAGAGDDVTSIGLGGGAIVVDVAHEQPGQPQEALVAAALLRPVLDDLDRCEPHGGGS
jgi:hypothetical protein